MVKFEGWSEKLASELQLAKKKNEKLKLYNLSHA